MDDRYRRVSELAAGQHGALSRHQLAELGVTERQRRSWETRGRLARRGPHSFVVAGSAPTWWRDLWCAQADLDGRGFLAGRTAARLHQLDGFVGPEVEIIVPRGYRLAVPWRVCTTSAELTRGDTITIDGLRCVTAQRLILDGPLFGFDRRQRENAIDSAIRLRKVSEQRLRTAVLAHHRSGINGSRALLGAMVDTGGESRLERRFLALVRRAGLPRPQLQRVVREGSRTIARVDAVFPGGVVVEIEGHGTHSSRQQRTADESRRNALVGRGATVRVFTYTHVTYQPEYVTAQLRSALDRSAA